MYYLYYLHDSDEMQYKNSDVTPLGFDEMITHIRIGPVGRLPVTKLVVYLLEKRLSV